MKKFEESQTPENKYREFKDRWYREYDVALESELDSEHPTVESISNIVVEKGMLDLYVPQDQEIKEYMKERRKFVWENREDPALYQRLFYAAECSKSQIGLSADPAITNVSYAVLKPLATRDDLREKIFQGMTETQNPAGEQLRFLLNKVQQIIGQKYTTLSGRTDLKRFEVGKKAQYQDVVFMIDGFSPTGCMRIVATDEENNEKVFKHIRDNALEGLSPQQFLSNDFKLLE